MKTNKKKYTNIQRGASLLEVILAIALALMLVPFMYNQISDMNNAVKDIAVANRIVKSRDGVINYIRVNQSLFSDDEEGTELSESELAAIAPMAHSGWVFKTNTQGSEITEIFLAFKVGTDYQTANIAKYIGNDAAIVSSDNVAYSQNWAIGVSEDFNFYPGDLIFRIAHDFGGDDKNKFLHRGTIWGGDSEEDVDLKLNRMQRNLHLNNFNIYNVAQITANTAVANIAETRFIKANEINASKIYFMSGATIKTVNANFGSLYVLGDVIDFKTINTKQFESSEMFINGATIAATDDRPVTIKVKDSLILTGSASRSFYFEQVTVPEIRSSYVVVGALTSPTAEVIISNEAYSSDNGSLTIGSAWTYPESSGPKLKNFSINGISDEKIMQDLTIKDSVFCNITDNNWPEVSESAPWEECK